jgi:diacylglycerol kinase (ATP)
MSEALDWLSLTRAVVVANPTAGQIRSSIIDELHARCSNSFESTSLLRTSRPDEAVAILSEMVADAEHEDTTLVIAVGGDGTVREVAEGLARGLGRWPGASGSKAQAALLIVPVGSGNSAYRALWGDDAWRETLEAVLEARGCRVRHIDLVRLVGADRASLLGVNFGLIARIAQVIERDKARSTMRSAQTLKTDEQSDDQARYWAAFGEVLGDLRPFPGDVEVDGKTIYRGLITLVAVGGVRSIGRGSFQLLPHALLDDGQLDVCVVSDLSNQRLAELGAAIPSGKHLGQPEVTYVQGSQVLVRRVDDQHLLIEHDGDPHVAQEVVTLDVVPAALPVVSPAPTHS